MADARTDNSFFWRRLHSVLGFFLVFFIIEHLLTNSQAALFIGQDGIGFIRMVNLIHSLPYLPAIEVGLLAVPIILHAAWGIKYLLTAKVNSIPSDGSTSYLPYRRNKAYTWQRITSWILLFAIGAHVAQMRFIRYPVETHRNGEHLYIVKLSMDRGLYTVAERLDAKLYSAEQVADERLSLPPKDKTMRAGVPAELDLSDVLSPVATEEYDPNTAEALNDRARQYEQRKWVRALEKTDLQSGEVNAVTNNAGTAILLTVRDVFKHPLMLILYTLFVPVATFHAFNGLWTFLITWGVALTPRSQDLTRKMCLGLMAAVTFLGWAAVWGTYWLNLRY